MKYDLYNLYFLLKAMIAMSALDEKHGHFAKTYKISQCFFSDQH